jgi:hypothetical protein
MPAAATISDLRLLLREQGLGTAVPAFEAERGEAAPTGFAELDALLGGGLPRGEISECLGGLSSGCTTVALAAIAQATMRGELATYLDASDGFDAPSAARAGVALERLLWVRCGQDKPAIERRSRRTSRAAQVWKAAQLIASAGGFGLIVMDLIGLPPFQLRDLQHFPWVGLRRTIAHGTTAVLVVSSGHVAGSVAAQTLSLEREGARWRGSQGVSLRLEGVSSRATILHQRRGVRGQTTACRLEASR